MLPPICISGQVSRFRIKPTANLRQKGFQETDIVSIFKSITKYSKLILNPSSAAPGFKIKNVWVMAGVPKIMQGMFASYVEPKLKKSKAFISKEIIVYRPEGDIADLVEELQNKYLELDVGSYPFYNPPNVGTNISIRGQNKTLLSKASKYFIHILKGKDILYSINQ